MRTFAQIYFLSIFPNPPLHDMCTIVKSMLLCKLQCYCFLDLCRKGVGKWNSARKKGIKNRQMSGSLLRLFAGKSGPLAIKIPREQRCCQACSLSAKFYFPAKGRSKSRRCVMPGPGQDIRRQNTSQAFWIQQFKYRTIIVMTDNGPSRNKKQTSAAKTTLTSLHDIAAPFASPYISAEKSHAVPPKKE